MKTALSIAGSDSSGGAGIQADLKTMTMNGVYAMSAITALTAQNTTGVSAILDVTPHFLQQQIDAVFTGRGEDRYGLLRPSHPDHRPLPSDLSGGQHRSGPCDGRHQWGPSPG